MRGVVDGISYGPLAVFYPLYSIGAVAFVIVPSIYMQSASLSIFLIGALYGLVCYGTYNLTNQATMSQWSSMTSFIGMVWKSISTGLAGVITLYLCKLFC